MSNAETPNTYVATIELSLAPKLKADLIGQGFTLSNTPHTLFSGKKSGVSCTLYESGKLVVQGKDKNEFIEFYLEPEILKNFTYRYKGVLENASLDMRPRIGIDESGKGDFFGPLCIAGVYAGGDDILKLKELGVRDSKDIGDAAIMVLSKKIQANFTYHIVKINPLKYNELYKKFLNLNSLLAWGHATTIEELVKKTECLDVIIDQFAAERVVITALKQKKMNVNLTQRHRGEEDVVVAAASILARATFLSSLEKMSREYEMTIPKGASKQTIQAAKNLVQRYGPEVLEKTGKLHFKTLDSIIPNLEK